ncbi:MAG: hypothetical protein RMJ16_06040 [Thermoguttaceae bacterium]|nr:hypothetical protein [Thermoguttaceae bacterium]
MVILSSEQLWPNLEGIVYWHERGGGLTDLFIYHTADKVSAEPALRLYTLVCQLYPRQESFPPPINIHLPSKPGGTLPHEVFSQIKRWRQQLPEHVFIVNITGGTKLMAAGALAAIHEPNTRIVYRELAGQWYEIRQVAAGQSTEPLNVPAGVCDHIPVQLLVELQHCPPGHRWESVQAEDLPIADLVRVGLETKWNWPETFRACGLPTDQAGKLFEQFVAASVRALGVGQVCLNLQLIGPGGRQAQEVDIAVSFRSRLYFLDCKLRSEKEMGVTVEGITSQIRQAAATRRNLGGVAAGMILIRPGYAFHENEKLLLDAYNLGYLDRNDTLNFFRRLAKFFGLPGEELPEPLAEAQALLDQAAQEGWTEAFAATRVIPHLPPDEPIRLPLHLTPILHNVMTDLSQDWLVYQWENDLYLLGAVPEGTPAGAPGKPPDALREALEWLEKAGYPLEWQNYRCSAQGNTFWVPFSGQPLSRLKGLRQLLASHRGQRLFGGHKSPAAQC